MIQYSATIDGEPWTINIVYYPPPIPMRNMDWFAGFDNDEGEGVYAPSLFDALEDLILDSLEMSDYCSLTYDRPKQGFSK